MGDLDFTLMLLLGFGLIIFNKQFIVSALNQRISMGVRITKDDFLKGRIFSIIFGLLLILFAFYIKYSTDWQFR